MPPVAPGVAAVDPLLLPPLRDRRAVGAAGAGWQVGSGRPPDAGAEGGDSADDPPGEAVALRLEVPGRAVGAVRWRSADHGDRISRRLT